MDLLLTKRLRRRIPMNAVATTFPSQTSQVPSPKNAAEVPGPVAGNTMTKEYVQMVGRMAYVWGWPLVNLHNRRAAFGKAPAPGLLGGVLPVAPVGQSYGFCCGFCISSHSH